MRTTSPTLAPVFRSDAQLRLLATLFLYVGEWTIGELADHAGISPSTASREVHRLQDSGLVTLRARGQQRIVSANTDLPWAGPLRELLDQTIGPIHHLRDMLEEGEWAAVDEAHIFGSWARRYLGERGLQPNDVDVVLVTSEVLTPRDLVRFERELARRIRLTVDAFAVAHVAWDHPSADDPLHDIKQQGTVRVARLPRIDGGR